MNTQEGILEAVRSDGRQMRWNEAFTRTNGGPGVWHNRYLIWAPGLAVGGSGGYLQSTTQWQNFADGGVESRLGYGFPSGSYDQVTGYAAMRFLCHAHDIEPPARRLKGEPFVPDPEILSQLVYATSLLHPPDSWQSIEPEEFWRMLEDAH